MLPYLPVQSQPASSRAGIAATLALLLGLGACGGERYTDWSETRPSVPRTSPWTEWNLPEGRTVSSSEDGLVVRYGHHGRAGSETTDVQAIDERWRGALAQAGFTVIRDQSREDRVSATFEQAGPEGLTGEGQQLAYAVSSQTARVGTRREKRRGEAMDVPSITVSVQRLPENARVPLLPPEPPSAP